MATTGQASASSTTNASREEGAESSRILGPFYEELELEGDTPSPTSDSYMLWDDWGGTWYDAEKRPSDDDEGNPVDSPDEPPLDPSEEDDLMCWAATASNVLEWTGWGKVSGMINTDQMFQHFQDHWYDDGGWMEWAWHWWFDGTSPPSGGSYVDVPSGGNFWSGFAFADYYNEETTDSQTLQAIDNFLHSGYGVGLGIFDGGDGGHAITCWGFDYNSSVDKMTHPNDYYLGIWVTDSDDSKGSAPPAPNLLQYYEVEYDGTNSWWYMPNYGGGDWHIGAVQALRARQYHSYAEIESGLRALESSGIAKVESIGVSVEGRQIWAIKISDDPSVDDENEPDILFVGLHHAREWISAEVPYYLAVNLVQIYESDESVKTLIDNSEIWIVPVLNPDGLEYSQHVDRMWRKNRRDNGDGTSGVDLNRNYGYMWGLDSGSSGETSAPTYRGPHAFSEPETIAIRDLISDPDRDFQAALSYHSYGQLILYPWGYTDESASDSSVMSALAAEMSDLTLSVHGETYTPQQSSQLYLTSGDLTDWVYGTTGVPAFTVELRPESSNPGFKLPESEISDTCEENWPAALYLIRWVVLSQGGFMDFEDGVDEAPIRSTIPGMAFTTTEGYDWVYGDIRTGQYNVNPYGSCYYECHGNFFAWLGPNQGMGRIDFVGATATSISMLTSTYYGTHLKAYDPSANLVDSDYAGQNTQTGTMSELAVSGSNIAYVIVHDTGNYWLIDDLRVRDLLRETSAFQPPDSESMFQTLDIIDIGAMSTYEFTNDQQQTLKLLLNWQGSQLGIQVTRPDGTIFDETESENPPIRVVIPAAEAGTWSLMVTAIDVPFDDYPFAIDVASIPTPPDFEPPTITVVTPREDPPEALQDGVTLEANVSDPSGVDWVTFSIRNTDGSIINPIFESMPATHVGDNLWQAWVDTNVPELPDGYYLLLVNASDMLGNEGSKIVQFSNRNWACLELLPATQANKAGRTMPVKFSLRVFENVDPDQPFVYNEELTIVIYEEGHPESTMQESTYGDTARDYRIDSIGELYITNFRTIRKKLTTYVVEIYRKDMLIGWFTFETVK